MGTDLWNNESVAAIIGALSGGGVGLLATLITLRLDRRAKQKEQLAATIENVMFDCLDYWRTNGSSPESEFRIVRGFERADIQINDLINARILQADLNEMWGDLWVSATSGAFQSSSRIADHSLAFRLKSDFKDFRQQVLS